MRYVLAAACAALIAAALAAPASAGTACMFAGTAVFVADDVGGCTSAGTDPSEVNNLEVADGPGGAILFTDTAPIGTDGTCTVAGNTATCPNATRYQFTLGGDNDSATVSSTAPTAFSDLGAGADSFQGGFGMEVVAGGAGDDTLSGAGGDDTLSGGDGADGLGGGEGADTVRGDDGNDTLDGGTSADVLDGGAGSDTVDGGEGPDTVEGGTGNDTVRGGVGDDFLESSRLACTEGAGSDALDGGPGGDLLCGGAGADSLNGGAGVDTATYRGRLAPVQISLDGAANDGGAGEGDLVANDVESLQGGSGPDTVAGADGTQLLDGGPGGDILRGLGGDDVLSDTGADGGADTLEGGDGDDLLAAGDGPDSYGGGDGADLLADYVGRVGGVTVTIDDAADDGETGEADNVRTDVEDVAGGTGNDSLTGSGGDNELSGGAGSDMLDGGGGNDGLRGGPGGDTIAGGAGSDHVDGEGGNDVIRVRDGLPDRAVCAGGTDRAEVDTRDDAFADCETVDVSRPALPVMRSAVVSRTGVVIVVVACPGSERVCAGGVTVKSVRRIAGRVRTLGVKSYRVLGGRQEIVRATIPKSQRRVLKRARRVKVRVIATNYNSATGERTTAARTFTVRTSGLRA